MEATVRIEQLYRLSAVVVGVFALHASIAVEVRLMSPYPRATATSPCAASTATS